MKTINYLTNLWRKVKAISYVQSRDKERISGRVNPRISPTNIRLDSLLIVSRQSDLRKFVARAAAILCLLVTVGVGSVHASQYVYDCSNNNNWVTTSGGSTKVSYGTAFTTTCYYTDGTAWSGTGGSNCSLNSSGYFFLGKSGATLVLPTYTNEKITSVVLHSSSGHSTSVSVNIYTTGGTAASSVVTWSTKNKDYVYAISTSYQASTLRIQVTNAYNTQFTRITINTAPNSSCAGTQLATPEVTATPSSGQIQLSWPAVANATKYQVSWNGGKFTDATSPFTKTSLTNSTPYTWAVKAIGNGSTYCDSEANEGSTKPSSTVYTITWKVYGESDKTTKVASGDHLMLPPSPSSCAVGTEFAGWSATNIGGTPTDTKPTFVSSQTTISANQTYYAVFATRTTNSYTKGDINDLFPGQTVLIVNESNAKALSDEYVAGQSGKRLQKVDVSISSSKITSSNTHIIWTVENCGLKYNFKTSTGYLRATMTGNDQLACNKGTDPWTLTSAGSNKFYMNSNSSVTSRLEYYSTNSYFTTYGTNATGTAYEMSFFVPTYTQYFTSCASCTADPTIGAASITNDPFVLTSLTGTITVNCSGGSTGSDNCTWADRGYVWSLGTTTTTPTVSNNKVAGTNGDKATGWAGWITPSGSTTPTAWEVGKTYYIRAYGKNGKDGATFAYGTAASFTLRSITFHSNGGTSVGPWYVNSGGTYEAPTAPTKDGYVFGGWYTDDGTFENPVDWSVAVSQNKDYYARWFTYGDYVFSCAELTLTGPSEDTVFITSAASKSVRSQEAFHLTGSGLTPSTEFTFSFGNDDLNSKFAFKLADGTTNVSTDENGAIDADIYVVYTPSGTDDGLDEATILTVSIAGAKPKTTTLNTKTIIGRHLPANFVIAAKKNGKWYALPSNMAASTPSPVEIAVDDSDNPSIAYTATNNMYSLYDQSAGEYIKLAMHGQSNAPLFGHASTAPIGKSGDAIITNTLGNGYLWKLVQSRATGLTNAKEAKYTIYCKNNSTNHLRLKDDAGNPKWGLYDAGIDELRLITASNATVAEAYFIEYSTNGGVIEVNASAISATKVLARFNGQTSGKIDLVQTCTSVKNRASIYNYTVTFNGGVNFAAKDAAGKILMLEWYNSSNELVGVTSIEMPRIIASSTTMSGYDTSHGSDNKGYWSGSEVHILPDVTLTGNLGSFSSGGEIKELHIYPGATFKITTGAATRTMHVETLVLRNGWSRAGSKRYDVARVHIATTANLTHTNAYADWYIDYDQYYPMAVPWDVTVSGISYRYTSLAATVGHDKNIRLRYYDGALRVNGGNGTGTNWRLYGETGADGVPATLKPSQGYAITAKRAAGKAFAIVRMPLTFADTWTALGEQGEVSGTHKDQVTVTAHGVNDPSKSWYAVGWNFIGNPYMSCFDSNEDYFMNKLIDENGKGVKYATIPDTEFEGFDQVNIASVGNKLKPSSGFFVQVNTTGPLQFKKSQIITPSAPARYTNEQESIPEQEAFILLNGEQGHDQMGLVIGSDYTADYEMNADLSKMLGNANIVKTWMRYTDMDMAYVAINEELVREWIPVTVHIPAEGEYTYSLMNSSIVDELEGLYLIDYETGAITNLIYDEYIFTAEAGTRADRFAINAIVGERKVPTGADITGVDKNGNEPVKFIWHDKVYILHNNVIYDATGKRVSVINK